MPLPLMTHDRATAQNFAFSPKKPKQHLVSGHVPKKLLPARLALIEEDDYYRGKIDIFLLLRIFDYV